LKEAEQRIREFSRPDPVLLARAYFLTAKVCHAEGQDDAGAKVLDEAIELMVSSPARDSAEHMIMTLALQDLNEVILPANEEIALREKAINALSENDSLRGYEETARLAHFYATRGDADNAAKWHLSVIVDARERIGVSHPIVVDHVDQLSQLYLDSGKPAKAVAVLEEHLRLARDEDPSTLPDAYVRAYGRELMKVYLLRQLAFALEQGGHTEEATSKWKEVVSLLEDPFTGEEIRRHSIAASLYREAKQRLDAEAE
jgi:tetratricopeptide (TPR) repeat protein